VNSTFAFSFVIAALGLLVSADAAPQGQAPKATGQEAKKKSPPRIEGILAAVDLRKGSITIVPGRDVDQVLTEKMRNRERPAKIEGERQMIPLATGKVEITISFRSSPSMANHLERTLQDLEPMVSWPVTVETRGDGNDLQATKIIAWRGAPWERTTSKKEAPAQP